MVGTSNVQNPRNCIVRSMDKILYFGYVVLTSIKHRSKLIAYSRFYSAKYQHIPLYFVIQAFMYYLKFSMHPLDYFYFNVYENPDFNPSEYASTLFMYRFHRKLNNKRYNKYFLNKILFHQRFESLMGHKYLDLRKANLRELRDWILNRNPELLIIKEMKSVGGFGVKRVNVGISGEDVFIDDIPLVEKLVFLKQFDLMEEFVCQHELINILNPSCLNTIRVVTVLDREDQVNIIGAVLRLGVSNDIDNFHSGGIAVRINLETGYLEGKGFRLAPSEQEYYEAHPVTQIKFDGYKLPHWGLLIETVIKACMVIPEVRTVGWDVAITQNGVSLIEGNNDWDKIIIEKALKSGIRKVLEKYLDER